MDDATDDIDSTAAATTSTAAASTADGGNDQWVYVGNLPHNAKKGELCRHFPGTKTILLRRTEMRHDPAKVALISFLTQADMELACRKNRKKFMYRRLLVFCLEWNWTFSPKFSVMVKNLDGDIREEAMYKAFQSLGPIHVIHKPHYNYAYIAFAESQSVRNVLALKRFEGTNIEFFPIQRDIPMATVRLRLPHRSIQAKCQAYGLKYNSEAETQTQLLVTNIPRYAYEDDVLKYLIRFGTITEWKMFPCSFSLLTNSAYVTFEKSVMARKAYTCPSHFFQGIALEIYNKEITYGETVSTHAVLLTNTSIFLTNEEIYEALSLCGAIKYLHRTSKRAIVRFESPEAALRAVKVKQIAEEYVFISMYTEQGYNAEQLVTFLPMRKASALREAKKELVGTVALAETHSLIETIQSFHYYNPDPAVYRNEVMVMNYPPLATCDDFRSFFKHQGLIEQFRKENVMGLQPAVFLSFPNKLEARRACALNQTMMNNKRVLVFMACERFLINPESTVLAFKLGLDATDEKLVDRLNKKSKVKFVMRIDEHRALVQFADALDDRDTSDKLGTLVDAVYKLYSLQQTATVDEHLLPLMPPDRPTDDRYENSFGPSSYYVPGGDSSSEASETDMPTEDLQDIITVEMTDVSDPTPTHTSNRPSENSLSRIFSLQPPLVVTEQSPHVPFANAVPSTRPANTALPNVPNNNVPLLNTTIAASQSDIIRTENWGSSISTSMLQLPPIAPAMLRLMQKVENLMLYTPAFTGMTMMQQYLLVNGIVNYIIANPNYFDINQENRIDGLMNVQQGFEFAHVLRQFPRGRPQQLLSLIEADYLETINQAISQSNPEPEVDMNTNNAVNNTESSISTMDKVNLVAAICEQFRQIPRLVKMTMDDKIDFLLRGFNDFQCANLLAQLPRPLQIELVEKLQKGFEPMATTKSQPAANVSATTSFVPKQAVPKNDQPTPTVYQSNPPAVNPILPFFSQTCNPYPCPPPFAGVPPPVDNFYNNQSTTVNPAPTNSSLLLYSQTCSLYTNPPSSANIPPQIEDSYKCTLASSSSTKSSKKSNNTGFEKVFKVGKRVYRSKRSPISDHERRRSRSRSRSRSSTTRVYCISSDSDNDRESRQTGRRRCPGSRSKSTSRSRSRSRSPARWRKHGRLTRRRPLTRSRSRSRSRSPPRWRKLGRQTGRRPLSRSRSKSKSRSRPRSKSTSPPRWRKQERQTGRRPLTRSRSRSRSASSPRSRSRSPARWSSSESESGSLDIRNADEPLPVVLISHVDIHVPTEKISEKFSQFGQIVSLRPSYSQNGQRKKTKRVYIEFDTYNQALQALGLHLTLYRGHIMRVRFANQRPTLQGVFAVKATFTDPIMMEYSAELSEVKVLERFKKHGPIANLYSRNSLEYLIVYKHSHSATAALSENHVKDSWKCVVTRLDETALDKNH
ncbi:uncharacterized protein LOC128742236 [Sabethes cyaneus]|uniref:uncharacterized protein LOC128742236 n=1 Tax=Sabethes cyaneus TaxID=53552 RepID=UPI00237D5EC8|nr:uncharacterized protein LOC128742236 [Sabethes cyaneus]